MTDVEQFQVNLKEMPIVWLELGQLVSAYCPLCLGCSFVNLFFVKRVRNLLTLAL